MDDNLTKHKIKELRALVSEGDRVAILLQDDPDPDAMSSAIALRTLLGRNKLTTPIFSVSTCAMAAPAQTMPIAGTSAASVLFHVSFIKTPPQWR